ncbi:MAG: hypothetical protein K8R88_00810 [Armatimonadetes bacterium]|nr:hypothetical protein [Armatimonadota bacterium]
MSDPTSEKPTMNIPHIAPNKHFQMTGQDLPGLANYERPRFGVLERVQERTTPFGGAESQLPYAIDGEDRQYIPDFIARIALPRVELKSWTKEDKPEMLRETIAPHNAAEFEILNLVIEVTGEKKKDKAAKVATAQTLWVPAVNAHGGLGKWAFIEIDDPWASKQELARLYT